MTIDSGTYVPRLEKEVTYWPPPDKDGDGEAVFRTGPDGDRDIAKDATGNPLYNYEPPKGFENRRTSNDQDNYVRVDERGKVVRTPTGEAITIKPGQALVENPDGSVEYLSDDWSRLRFSRHHEKKSLRSSPAKKSQSSSDDKKEG